MSTLQVANLHFETTGANRIEYTGNNVVRVRANGGFQLPFGTSAQRANGDVGLIRYNTDTGLVESFGGAGTWDALPTGPVFNVAYGVANAAFSRANSALQNTSGTFAGNLSVTGNVGVGTSSPVSPLSLLSTGSGVSINFNSNGLPQSTTRGGLINYWNDGTTYYNDFWNWESNGVFRVGTAANERMRISASGDVFIGTNVDAGNTLRYFDIQNTNTGASAGVITRFITSNSAGTGVTTVDFVKYKNGLFVINNNDSAGTFTINNAGAERMRIDSAGRVTTPNQPYCRVVSSAGNVAVVAGTNIIPFNSALNNVGGHFNTSNYRFTLPVTGNYLVSASIQLNGGTAQYYNLYIRLNASGQFGTFQTGENMSYQQLSTVGTVLGNASDYIDIALFAVTGSGTIEASGDSRCSLSIILLG